METININLYDNPNPGFGWTVDCDGAECGGFDHRMLSEDGAKSLAKEHLAEHRAAIKIERY